MQTSFTFKLNLKMVSFFKKQSFFIFKFQTKVNFMYRSQPDSNGPPQGGVLVDQFCFQQSTYTILGNHVELDLKQILGF